MVATLAQWHPTGGSPAPVPGRHRTRGVAVAGQKRIPRAPQRRSAWCRACCSTASTAARHAAQPHAGRHRSLLDRKHQRQTRAVGGVESRPLAQTIASGDKRLLLVETCRTTCATMRFVSGHFSVDTDLRNQVSAFHHNPPTAATRKSGKPPVDFAPAKRLKSAIGR